MPGELTAKPRDMMKRYFAFPCSFAKCSKAFPTAQDLRIHKIRDPDHHFCPDDNYEATDYEDIKRHNVCSELHNTCPSSCCAATHIQTMEALRLHVMKHRGNKFTTCAGCRVQYYSPEALWGHLDLSKAPVVCRGPLNVNVAKAQYNVDKRQYAWKDYMKKTGWHHHDQNRWYSDPPDWFLECLDSDNNYVSPVRDPNRVPESVYSPIDMSGWTESSSDISSINDWTMPVESEWKSSKPDLSASAFPTLGSRPAGRKNQQQKKPNKAPTPHQPNIPLRQTGNKAGCAAETKPVAQPATKFSWAKVAAR